MVLIIMLIKNLKIKNEIKLAMFEIIAPVKNIKNNIV